MKTIKADKVKSRKDQLMCTCYRLDSMKGNVRVNART
jgi:hypothetical protein